MEVRIVMEMFVTLIVIAALVATFREELTWLLRAGVVLLVIGLACKAAPVAVGALAGPVLMLVLMAVAVSFLLGRPGGRRGR